MQSPTALIAVLLAFGSGPAALAAKTGSHDADVKDYPFVVSVGFVEDSYYLLQCAGTILDEYHILSTAHCYDK